MIPFISRSVTTEGVSAVGSQGAYLSRRGGEE